MRDHCRGDLRSPVAASIPSPIAIARAQAAALLAEATLPVSAVWVTSAPASAPSGPFESIGCKPLIDVDRFAVLRQTSLTTAQDEVMASAPGHPASTGETQRDGVSQSAGVVEIQTAQSSLTITLRPTAAGDVSVRVDAMVAPRGATCVNPGGPMQVAPTPTPTPTN